jgi:hypothetical protein
VNWPVRLTAYFGVLRLHESSFVWMSPDGCLLPERASNVALWRIVIITLSPGARPPYHSASLSAAAPRGYQGAVGNCDRQSCGIPRYRAVRCREIRHVP